MPPQAQLRQKNGFLVVVPGTANHVVYAQNIALGAFVVKGAVSQIRHGGGTTVSDIRFMVAALGPGAMNIGQLRNRRTDSRPSATSGRWPGR